jgi:shikimate dehydrogenase
MEKLYILGHPVAHSKSPVMYNALYTSLGLDWRYDFMDLETREAADAFLAQRDFLSINITTPYKPAAFAAADVMGASAKLARGVNLLVQKQGALLGYNVDGDGAVRYLQREGVKFKNSRVAICGTGPTAVSIMHSCVQAGAAHVLMLGRDRERAQARVNAYLDDYRELLSGAIAMPSPYDGWLGFAEAYENAEFSFGAYKTSRKAIAAADIIIDATPLGMNLGDPAPFDTSIFLDAEGAQGAPCGINLKDCAQRGSGKVFFDTVYGHGETAFCAMAKCAGGRVFDGGGMLVSQAVLTAKIVSEVAELDVDIPYEKTFDLMAGAAGFDFV